MHLNNGLYHPPFRKNWFSCRPVFCAILFLMTSAKVIVTKNSYGIPYCKKVNFHNFHKENTVDDRATFTSLSKLKIVHYLLPLMIIWFIYALRPIGAVLVTMAVLGETVLLSTKNKIRFSALRRGSLGCAVYSDHNGRWSDSGPRSRFNHCQCFSETFIAFLVQPAFFILRSKRVRQ